MMEQAPSLQVPLPPPPTRARAVCCCAQALARAAPAHLLKFWPRQCEVPP